MILLTKYCIFVTSKITLSNNLSQFYFSEGKRFVFCGLLPLKPQASLVLEELMLTSEHFAKTELSIVPRVSLNWLTLLVFQELEEIRKCGMKNFRNIQVDEANLLTWQGLIVPVSMEYFLF